MNRSLISLIAWVVIVISGYAWAAGVPFTGTIDWSDVEGGKTSSDISYSTSTSGLSETDVQGALDELATMIADVTTGGLSDIDQLPGDTTDDDKIDLTLLTATPSFESMTLTGTSGLTLGVAGTTQGALVIASNTHAVYKNTIVPGTMTESVSWRLPGAMPAGADYLVNCDVTTGQMGYTNPATFQAADTDLTTWAGVTPSVNGQSLVSAANYAAMRGLLDLEAGTDFNAYDYDLGTLASGITGIVKGGGNGGGFSAASAGTDYLAPTGSASQLTGYSTGAQPLDADLTALAGISGQRGDVIYYGSAGWTRLAKGTENYVLTQGANDPAWAAATGGGASTLDDLTDAVITSAEQGDVLYFNGTNWVNLAHGSAGQYLKTGGNAANPSWDTPAGAGDMLASAYPAVVAIEGLNFADASIIQLTGADASAVLTSGGNNYILGSNSDNSALEFKTPANVLSQIGAQAADADLTTYAGITPAANTQTFLGSANYAAMRTNMGVAIGSDVQAYDADLTTYAGITPSANIQSLLGSADYSAARTNLGLAIGTNVQAYDADLTPLASGITGLVLGAGNGGGYAAAVAGTDYPGLASANTFTGNNTFGNADTDTLTSRGIIVGGDRTGSNDAVQIAATLASPTYATGTNELYVAGDIETAGNVYATQFIGAATGDSYVQLANNSGGLSGSGYRLWFETDTTDQLKYSVNGTEKAVVNVQDAQTLSGAKTLSSALTLNRGATGAGQLVISEDSDDGTNAVTITGQAMSASYTLTLPADDGTNGQALLTNGSGVTSWGSVSATAAGDAAGQVQYNTGGTGGSLAAESAFSYDATNNALTIGANALDGTIILYNESGETDYNLTIQPGTQSGAATITMPGSTATLATLGLAETLSGAKTFSANVTLDDGTGASPSFTFQDGTDETAVFSKVDAGYLTVTTVAGDGFGVLVGNLTVGNGSPGQTLNGEDAYIEGLLEVDGIAYLDGGLTSGGAVALGANNLTMTGSLAATGARVTKGWFTDVESTNMPTVGGTALFSAIPATLINPAASTWTVVDNNASGLSIGSTGKADIFKVVSTDAAEGVTMSGTLGVTGLVTASAGITVADSQVLTFDESAANPDDADIQLSATDGVFKIASVNGANNEDLTIDLDAGTNMVAVKSGSGVTDIDYGDINLLAGYLQGLTRGVVLTHASGVHDGSNDQATLTDSGESFTTNSMVGMTIYNITDGSSGLVTANNGTTITATLSGGTGNDWDTNDVWQVGPGPDQSGSVFYVGAASTIRHPATVGYVAQYYATAAAAITVDVVSASMVITNATAAAVDAGDSIDSPATAGSFICLHNASATLAYSHGKNGTWTDGGAD